jgi:hypothetical protein
VSHPDFVAEIIKIGYALRIESGSAVPVIEYEELAVEIANGGGAYVIAFKGGR